jgi:hypothetical protein
MKLKQAFNGNLGNDKYDSLLIAIRDGAPHIYNEYRAENFSDVVLVAACWDRRIYNKIMKIKSFI